MTSNSSREEDGLGAAMPPTVPIKTAAGAAVPSPGTTQSTSSSMLASSRARLYRTTGESKWVTREIAALDFLLGIPMENENAIVEAGYLQQQERKRRERTHGGDNDEKSTRNDERLHGEEEKREEILEPPTPPTPSMKWWDKLINKGEVSRRKPQDEFSDLEQPHQTPVASTQSDSKPDSGQRHATSATAPHPPQHHLIAAPGRRLDGRDAVRVQIPLSSGSVKTRHRSIARQSAIREWELRVAHGLEGPLQPSLLDGRVYFSSKESYPVGVFSVLKYEPKKEEAARRRRKLEARGGGGTQFVIPERDWRGTSYRALLPRFERKNRSFQRYLRDNRNGEIGDDSSSSEDDDSSSSGESDTYVPGFLDDPEMRQGRHRHVMVGDRVTGCIVSSTIQFVTPADLKADLNKQFRERFDGWEPPKSQRKYIGARVVDGVYTLMDPTETAESEDRFSDNEKVGSNRRGIGSVSSSTSGENTKESIRMPPSLTLSKIRSVKQQALVAVVKADLEISTAALACVYFERLCLDCRVDKSNRRLSFAACLLLAAKINESNVALVMQRREGGEEASDKKARLQSLIRPSKRSSTMFASLLEFFTHDWSLSLKNLFAAEWGVFAALGFSLHASPSQVAFHFKRFMKVLGWGQLAYLGRDQYNRWQGCLVEEAVHQEERDKRRAQRRQRGERALLELQRELHRQQENEVQRGSNQAADVEGWQIDAGDVSRDDLVSSSSIRFDSPSKSERMKRGRMKLLNRFSLKRQHPSMPGGMDKLMDRVASSSIHEPSAARSIVRSPSLPLVTALGDSEDKVEALVEVRGMDVADMPDDFLSDAGGINV